MIESELSSRVVPCFLMVFKFDRLMKALRHFVKGASDGSVLPKVQPKQSNHRGEDSKQKYKCKKIKFH